MRYSIVWLSEMKKAGFRIDAEYWHPDFIQNAALVSPERRIRDFVAPHIPNIKSTPIGRDFAYLEIANIATELCTYETKPVLQGEEPSRAQHILEPGDVAVSTVRPNRNAVAFIVEEGLIGSSGLAVLRAEGIAPEYLFAFCKTNYFVKCLVRACKATMYPAVTVDDVQDTPLFVPSPPFETLIAELVKDALLSIDIAKEVYSQAETQLLSEVGLIEWRPEHRLTFIVNYSEMKKAGRMDAEYFQPKYGELVDAIKGYPGGWDTLGNLANLNAQNYLPESGREYQYIELANIGRSGEVTDCMQEQGQDLPSRARRRVATGDVIVSSVEGSLESVALIDSEYDQALCSTGFHVVNSSKLNSETLLVLLKSPVGQLQLKRGCSGTILSAINRDEFSKITLPLITSEAQAQIREQVAESAYLRRQSRRLLDGAKTAVELAIEQGEAAALAWLEQEGALG